MQMQNTIQKTNTNQNKNTIVQARALQYCLEEDNNILEDDAWIVHLDEETLLTEASVRGIMNFITADKHSFGQGTFIVSYLMVRF